MVLLTLCLLHCCVAGDTDTPLFVKEKKLMDTLFNSSVYSKAISPQVFADRAVRINVSFNLVSILDIVSRPACTIMINISLVKLARNALKLHFRMKKRAISWLLSIQRW